MKVLKQLIGSIILIHVVSANCPFERKSDDVPIMEPTPTTPNGCTCISDCKASWQDLYKKDWCKTADQCGEYAEEIKHHWDYCSFDKIDFQLENLDWKTKHDALWAAIKENATLGPYGSHHVTILFFIFTWILNKVASFLAIPRVNGYQLHKSLGYHAGQTNEICA